MIHPNTIHSSDEQCHYVMPPARAIDPDPCEKQISTQGLKLVLPALWGVPKFRDIASNPCHTPCPDAMQPAKLSTWIILRNKGPTCNGSLLKLSLKDLLARHRNG
jgi:hypothetical protein